MCNITEGEMVLIEAYIARDIDPAGLAVKTSETFVLYAVAQKHTLNCSWQELVSKIIS